MDNNCPVHQMTWKHIPAGVSQKTGRAYPAFSVCPVAGCKQRPTTLDMNDPLDAAIAQTPAKNDYIDPQAQVDKRSHRIERQHSQDMALQYFQAKGITDFTDEDLKMETDWFMEDLDLPDSTETVEG